MKKKNLKKDNRRYSEKISIDHEMGDKEYAISFQLTAKETKKYFEWLNGYIDSKEIDEDEDPICWPVKFEFSPYEMGTRITAKLFNKEILLRTAWEDDEVKQKKY